MIYKTNSGYGVNFNQLIDKGVFPTTQTVAGITFTNNGDGSITANGTNNENYYSNFEVAHVLPSSGFILGHKYAYIFVPSYQFTYSDAVIVYGGHSSGLAYGEYAPTRGSNEPFGVILTCTQDSTNFAYCLFRVLAGKTVNNLRIYFNFVDLTQMFGSGNEPTTVAEFREMYSDDYYDYTLSQWQWAKKGKITSYPTPVIENGTTLLPIENHIVGLAHYNDGNTDIIYNYAKRELPAGFVRLDYIESTGTQYIDTGVVPNGTPISVETEFMFLQNADSNFFGARNGVAGSANCISFGVNLTSDKQWHFIADHDWVQSTSQVQLSTNYIVKFHATTINQSLEVDGIVKASQSSTINLGGAASFYFFATNAPYVSGGINGATTGRAKYLKIYKNNTLVRNFIPCYRYSDGIEGLYDTVGKQFYTNQGTGRFIRGKEIDSGNLLDLSKFVEGYPSDMALANTTPRKYNENTYVLGLTRTNYYFGNTYVSITINDSSFVYTTTDGGNGVGFISALKANTSYKLYYQADTTTSAIYAVYYDNNGNVLGDAALIEGGTIGANNITFTTRSDMAQCALLFRTTGAAGTITFSNISLHEVN